MQRSLQELGAANHQSFFAVHAESAGGTVRRAYGGTVAYRPAGAALVAFPCVPEEETSDVADELLALFRSEGPFTEVGWWLLDERYVPVWGPRLLARGFDWGWRPNWMALDVASLVEDHPGPSDLSIAEESGSWHRFVASLAGAEVGGTALHLDEVDGELVAGIYGTDVVPEHRRCGIGTALTVAACRRARDAGCRWVVLNATSMGEPVYRRAGFEALGEAGQTWWMPKVRLEAPPPSRSAVEFVEGIGSGDLAAVARALRNEPRDLDAALACGQSPLEVADLTGQQAAARWLVDHGATRQPPTK